MTKVKLLLIKFAPSIVGAVWLFVCVLLSELGLTRHRCTMWRMAEGTAVGFLGCYATGYVLTRLWMAKEDSHFARLARQYKAPLPWKRKV